MIEYQPGKWQLGFVCQVNGSVFPRACAYAVPSGLLAVFLKIVLYSNPEDNSDDDLSLVALSNNAAYAGFSFVVGFLLVFRTSQAYSRFWDGATKVQQMQSKWCDACGSLIAFSRKSKRSYIDVLHFQNILVRLFSLMHSLALQQIHSLHDESFQVIDLHGLDQASLDAIKTTATSARVELVSAWIHQLIVDNIDTGIMPAPPPIQSRVFQELSNGTMNMNNAQKIAATPFPFPYAQMSTVLLLIHWILTPILMCSWTGHWVWSFIWTFTPVLSFWCINLIAAEIEQPFGNDANDLPTHGLQETMNETLILLLNPLSGQVPTLSSKAIVDPLELTAIYNGEHDDIQADSLATVSRSESWVESAEEWRERKRSETARSSELPSVKEIQEAATTNLESAPPVAPTKNLESAPPVAPAKNSESAPAAASSPPQTSSAAQATVAPSAGVSQSATQQATAPPAAPMAMSVLDREELMLKNSCRQVEILQGVLGAVLENQRLLTLQLGSLAPKVSI